MSAREACSIFHRYGTCKTRASASHLHDQKARDAWQLFSASVKQMKPATISQGSIYVDPKLPSADPLQSTRDPYQLNAPNVTAENVSRGKLATLVQNMFSFLSKLCGLDARFNDCYRHELHVSNENYNVILRLNPLP